MCTKYDRTYVYLWLLAFMNINSSCKVNTTLNVAFQTGKYSSVLLDLGRWKTEKFGVMGALSKNGFQCVSWRHNVGFFQYVKLIYLQFITIGVHDCNFRVVYFLILVCICHAFHCWLLSDQFMWFS